MAAYLTLPAALTRLDAYGIDPESAELVTNADLRAASDELDYLGPFVGYEVDSSQERAFPRVVDDTLVGVTPEAVLDWVALRALQACTDEEPAVTSESVGPISTTFADPKRSIMSRRLSRLLQPWIDTRANPGWYRDPLDFVLSNGELW